MNESYAPQIHRGGLSSREGLVALMHDGHQVQPTVRQPSTRLPERRDLAQRVDGANERPRINQWLREPFPDDLGREDGDASVPKETPLATVERLARETLEVLTFVGAAQHEERDHLRMVIRPRVTR